MSEINKDIWERILNHLEGLNRYLTNNPTESELKNRIGFLFVGETEKILEKTTSKIF